MIGIVDYGLGNLRSIQNMLHRAGAEAAISSDPEELLKADRLILPGVGHFRYGMDRLRERGLAEVVRAQALERQVPVLGICLGAQLLGLGSEEGDAEGLALIPMRTVAFDRTRLGPGDKVPHMGWADTEAGDHPLFAHMPETPPRFYYVHSYHFACDDPRTAICWAEHGYRFVSGVAKGAIIGVQFHPEKSHVFGLRLLKTWAAMDRRPQ